jgi:steroid delta-isomerase-like uncharacterized protein
MKRNLFSVTLGFVSKTVFLIVGSFLLLAIIPSLLQLNSTMGEETITIESNINKARQVIEAFNTGNVSNVSEFISPLYFNYESQIDPVRGELRGSEEFIGTIKNLRTAFPDLHHEEQIIISQNNIVVSIINVTGTHTGNFFILPPTGKKISYEAVHIYQIGEDGKIVEHKAIRDDLTFLAQLGVIEASSPEYKSFFQALTGTTNSSR